MLYICINSYNTTCKCYQYSHIILGCSVGKCKRVIAKDEDISLYLQSSKIKKDFIKVTSCVIFKNDREGNDEKK